MKIVMLLDNPFVSDTRVEKEASALINFGASVTVIATINNNSPKTEERNGIRIIRLLGEDFNSPLRIGYKSFIQNQAEQILTYEFDILHCHDFHMLSIGVEIKKKKPLIKLIYDAHEFLIGWPYYQTTTSWVKRFKGMLVWNYLVYKEKKEMLFADSILTITDGIAERMQKNAHLKKRPIVVGNYPEKSEICSNKNYFQKKYNLPSARKILIHSGSIYHTDQQLVELFKIILSMPDLSLVFIGNHPRFFEIEKQVQSDENLKKRIFFHDFPSNQSERINLMAAGDISIMHVRDRWIAHKIGFSNRFVEYLMAELPIIATPQEFSQEINSVYHCGTFYHENNTNELKKGLETLLTHLTEYIVNVKRAKEYLDWETESQKLINLYHSLYD